MSGKRYTVLFVSMVASAACDAQSYPRKEIDPGQWIESVVPAQVLDLNYGELYENIVQRLANPIDLNRASDEDLRSLFVLRESQVQSLLAYRDKLGPLLSVYELQAVPGFDPETLYKLMPFVRVRDANEAIDKSLFNRIASEPAYAITRYEETLQQKKGYREDIPASQRYAGGPGKLYSRYRLSRPGDFSFGFTTEKDAGEAWRWNPRTHYYGMDFYSFHAQLLRKGRTANLIVGDFQAQFGQGIILGGGFGTGKGAETITAVRRSNLGFLPYSSLGESGFFRGIAWSYSISRLITVHVFASSLRRDGHVVQDSSWEDGSLISSFALTGYHRTPTEVATRESIREVNGGGVVSFKKKNLETGLIFHRTSFDHPLFRDPTIYNQFVFRGLHNSNAGAYLNYSVANVSFFSEVARTSGHGNAAVAGMLASFSQRVDGSMVFRSFQKDFTTSYGNALSENTQAQNEQGVYWGLKYQASRRIFASAYLDLFRFPWLRYRAYAPGEGSEGLLRLTYQPSRSVTLFVQVRQESKPRNLPANDALYRIANGTKRNFWFNCDYSLRAKFSFRTRIQFSSYRLGPALTRGFAVMQDFGYSLGRVRLSMRYALFDTDDYDNRLYAYERDVWLAVSFPAYYGVGVRKYAVAEWRINRRVDLWLRWGRTRFVDRDVIGSGGETIAGNIADDVKLQLRVKL